MNKAFGKRSTSLVWVAVSLLLLVFSNAQAQSGEATPPQSDDGRGANGQNIGRRGDPLRALNLTIDQLQQIRAIREESKDEWRAVRQRLGEAHRALDEAVYSDNADEGVIEERARDVGVAQAAVARMRALTELKIRRVLTPEQLNTLRAMRQQARAAERNNNLGNGFGQRPLRRERFGQRDGGGQLQRGRRP